MSAPVEPPPPPSASPSAATSPWRETPAGGLTRSRQLRVATVRATGVLWLATAIAILLGAWPLVEGAIAGERPDTARRGLARVLRARGWAVGQPAVKEHRVFEGSRATGRSRRMPPEILEGLPEPLGLRERRGERPEPLEGGRALSRARLHLLERADPDAETAFTVAPITPLVVVEDLGEWLLLELQQEGRQLRGWTRRDSVTIIP